MEPNLTVSKAHTLIYYTIDVRQCVKLLIFLGGEKEEIFIILFNILYAINFLFLGQIILDMWFLNKKSRGLPSIPCILSL